PGRSAVSDGRAGVADLELGAGTLRARGERLGRRRGRDGAAGLVAYGAQPGGEAGLGLAGVFEQLRRELREALRGQGAVGHDQQPGRLRREREAVELRVVAQRLLVEADKRVVERVLEHARVAPRRAGSDLLAFVQRHARAALGEERRERAADDAAAD